MAAPDNRHLWAIIPIKPVQNGKSRLAAVLTAPERRALILSLMAHLVTTLQAVPEIAQILIVSRDEEVAAMAQKLGAATLAESAAAGLNAAVQEATCHARAGGATGVVILPVDLPLLTAGAVRQLLHDAGSVVIVPDSHLSGTNALLLRGLPAFRFHFGEESFTAHLHEAARHGCLARVRLDDAIAFDLDTPADWFWLREKMGAESADIFPAPPVEI
jgi:2-phospho-L-lactate guanylyltransferase